MKLIELSRGLFAKVDDADYPTLVRYKWYATTHNRKTGYAARDIYLGNGKSRRVYMHAQLIKTPKGLMTDHIDGDGLNNQRANLRACTVSQNLQNRSKPASNTSGFKGVDFHKATQKWRARINSKYTSIHIGLFGTPEEAATAYANAAKKLHRNFAHI